MNDYSSKLFILIMLFLVITIGILRAQNFIDHIGSEDGLTTQLCQYLQEDIYGNIWVSSFDNYMKYNGYEVTAFPLSSRNNSYPPIKDIISDKTGNVWILQGADRSETRDNYHINLFNYLITIIHPLTNEKYTFEEYMGEELPEKDIVHIQEIGGTIYLITVDNKVYSYDTSLQLYTDFENFDGHIKVNEDGHIVKHNSSKIEISDSKGKIISRLDSNYLRRYPAFTINKKGKVFLLNKAKDSIIIEKFEDNKLFQVEKNLVKTPISKLRYMEINLIDNSNLIYNNQIVTRLDRTNSNIEEVLAKTSIYDYLISQSGLHYFATNVGIYVFEDKDEVFGRRSTFSSTHPTHSVRAIMIDNNLSAYKVDEKEILISPNGKYDLQFLEEESLGKLITQHYWDPKYKTRLWSVGHLPHGKRLIDFKNKTVNYFEYGIKFPHRSNCIIRSSLNDQVYLGGTNGLYHLRNDKFFPLNILPINGELQINQLVEERGQLWIASSAGLLIMDNDSTYKKHTYPDSVSYPIQFIHPDNDDADIYWIGTHHGGLFRWNYRTNNSIGYNTATGLSNNDIHAIHEDEQGRLWLPTNNNLSCLDKETGHIAIFTEQDGIAHSEFNRHGYYHDTTTNIVYFGGLNGYTFFNPDSVSTSVFDRGIDIRVVSAQKTKKNAESENISQSVILENRLEFLEDDLSIKIDLTTNRLANTKEINYFYRIANINEEWIATSGNFVNLNRLPYGNHMLEIASDRNRPSYTSNTFTIPVSVIQPFSKTWSFFWIMVIGSIMFIWFCVKLYLKNLQERNTKLENLVKERTKELERLNETKNKIFTILAHDLRNPISSLKGLGEKTKFLAYNNRLSELEILSVQSEAKLNALNDNLNNILYWSLNENDMLTLHPKKYVLLAEIKKIITIYSSQINQKKLSINLNIENNLQVFEDINVLQTLIRNYVTNAIKFSYPKGVINFSIENETENNLILKIEDNGIGLDNNSDNNETENQIRNSGRGSGIGLRITEELAEKANIKISICSQQKKGTSVFITFTK